MRKLILILFIGITSTIYVQSSKIGGYPVVNVEVTLKQNPGSKIIKQAVTNELGLFEFLNLSDGKYIVDFSTKEGGKQITHQDLQMNIDVKSITERRNKIMDHLMARESQTMSVSMTISENNVRGTVMSSIRNFKNK